MMPISIGCVSVVIGDDEDRGVITFVIIVIDIQTHTHTSEVFLHTEDGPIEGIYSLCEGRVVVAS